MMMVWSMPWVMFWVGATRAPPRPAKKQPMQNTAAKTQLTFMPMAATISRSTAAALANLPILVLLVSSQSPRATRGPSSSRKRL